MRTRLRLGIDTGGTYTDAALINDGQKLVASAKSLTTHSNLSVGIREVINTQQALFCYSF